MTDLWFKILILDAVIVDARVALYGSNKVSKPGKEFFHDMQD
jgi:hypothetical protein